MSWMFESWGKVKILDFFEHVYIKLTAISYVIGNEVEKPRDRNRGEESRRLGRTSTINKICNAHPIQFTNHVSL